MGIINTSENLLLVLRYASQQINASVHVNPIVYEDNELGFLTKNEIQGIGYYRDSLAQLIIKRAATTILHYSVFTKTV